MPLLNGESFYRHRLEAGLHPNTEIYYCESTGEAFANYDQFFERAVLISSMAWTCSATGKKELTFQEAVESEAAAHSSLESVSIGLQKAMLYLTKTISVSKLNDICHFLWSFTSCRFFVDEEVEVLHLNEKKPAKIVKVIAPSHTTWDSLAEVCFGMDPSGFKYDVMSTSKSMKPFRLVLPADRISRPKGNLTKDRVKLFLKQHVNTYKRQSITELKDSSSQSYELNRLRWEDVFAGPLPSPDPDDESFPTNKKSRQFGTPNEKSNDKSDRKSNTPSGEKRNKPGPKPLPPEERKQRLEEQKKNQAEKKKLEREKAREEKLKQAKLQAEWSRKRDDLECDDLKPLVSGIPIQCDIPNALFGDAVLIMEFYHNFDEFFDLKEIFPHGFTFDLLLRVLCEKSLKSPVSDLIRITLATIFCLQEGEDAETDDKKDSDNIDHKDESANDDDEIAGDLRMAMNHSLKLLNTLKRVHGPKISTIETTPLTVSEVLRLHLLTSGAPRPRTIYRGWFNQKEDPGLLFRIERPDIIEKMSSYSLYELEVDERIAIFDVLINQVMSYPAFRDILEATVDRIVEVRKEMRSAQADFARWERENTLKKLSQRKEGEADTDNAAARDAANPEVTEEMIANFTAEKEKRCAALEKYLSERRQRIRKFEAQYSIKPIGRDRAYRRYWIFNSIPGLFIEHDDPFTGQCVRRSEQESLKMPSLSPTNNKENEFGEHNKSRSLAGGMSPSITALHTCSGNPSTCIIHTNRQTSKYKWRFCANPENVQEFMDCLNPRGFRESELLSAFKIDQRLYEQTISESPISKLNTDIPTESRRENSRLVYYKASMSGMSHLDKDPEISLKMIFLDHLLSFEEQLFLSGLSFRANSLMTRDQWKSQALSVDASESNFLPQMIESLHKLGNNIPSNHLKSDWSISKWNECLDDTSSTSRLFFLLSLLETKIEFPQNVSGYCRICRRKKDAESMLLCDSCNRGHHTYCLKPPLDEVPKGEWFCPKCKQVPKLPKSPQKPVKYVDVDEIDELDTIESSRTSSPQLITDNDMTESEDETEADESLCAICGSTDDDPEAECSRCGRRYHYSCHNPKIPPSSRHWICSSCHASAKNTQSKRKDVQLVEDKESRPKRTRVALNDASSDQIQTSSPHKSRTSARSTRHSDDDGYNYVLCYKMLDKLKRHQSSWPFLKRPIGKEAPNYNEKIKTHVDLGILTQNLNTGVYTSNGDFVRDACLMFGNCKAYWNRGTEQHEAGIELHEFFRSLVKEHMPQEAHLLKHR